MTGGGATDMNVEVLTGGKKRKSKKVSKKASKKSSKKACK
jgi:hypothetical protein